MASFEHLPQELVDRILDEFGSVPIDSMSRRTLLACSLVCKSFSYRARQSLLADIEVTSWTPPSQVASLCSILKSTPSPSKYIRYLRFKFDEENANTNQIQPLFNLIDSDQGMNLEILAVECCYCGRTPRVPMTFTVMDQWLRDSLLKLGGFSSLTALYLKSLDIPIAFLSRFYHLKTLSVDSCTFRPLGADNQLERDVFANLESFYIVRCIDPLTQLLLSEVVSGSSGRYNFYKLKMLHCLFTDTSELRYIWNLLKKFGAGAVLESLELVEVSALHIFLPIFIDCFDLSQFKSLRNLKLRSTMAYLRGRLTGSTTHLLFMPPLLCASTSIEVVDITIDGSVANAERNLLRNKLTHNFDISDNHLLFFLQKYGWTDLDDHLSDTCFYPSLQGAHLSIQISPDVAGEPIVKNAERRLGPELGFKSLDVSIHTERAFQPQSLSFHGT